MERLSWYLKRLSVMEPGEIRHRIGERWRLGRLAAGQRTDGHAAVSPPADWRTYAFCTAPEPVLPALPWDEAGLAEAANGARQGAWPALGFDWTWRADDADAWRRAPDTARLWPSDFFGAIPYRAGNPHGDSRVVWEPARLQQLVALAWLAQRGGEGADETAALAAAQLRSWVAANPPYRGVHYVSVMECALRLIAACHALDLLRAWLPAPEETWPALLAIVASHAPLIARRLSLFSSSGNHTIAEAVGLLYAGVLFGEFPQAPRWRATGLDLLAREAARQVLPDGGGIERAFHYHRFVLDLLALAGGLLARRGEPVPDTVTAALDRGRRFLAAVTLPDGETLPVGDGDGGYALSRFVRLNAPPMAGDEPVAHFPETGYSVLRAEGGRSTLALFDHGALGMPPSYGHAHADALSFVLYRDGEAVLIDPGTFTYTGDPAWRRYFRSTAAHNTMRIDGADQSAQETAFQWSAPRPCRLVNADVSPQGVVRMLGDFGDGGGTGYRHLRGVAYCPDEWIFIWDLVPGDGMRLIEQHWHCGVAVRPTALSRTFELAGQTGSVLLRFRGAEAPPQVLRGERSPPLGWRSPLYGRKEPCTVIRRAARLRGPVTFDTIVTLSGPGPDNTVMGETIVRWQKWAHDAGAY
jgi:Heparinase II/III-like protein/Heparinase II/III N-terminus